MKISAVIITKNEEEKIGDCLASLTFADEIVVIDNKSTDKTKELAQKAGARVYVFGGLDFSYLRNVGKEKAKGDWLFYIDADERVSSALAKDIKIMVSNDSMYDAYSVIRKNYFFNAPWPKSEKMVRFMRKNTLIGWQGSLHETPIVAGKIGELPGELTHFTHDDLSLMVKKTNEWSEIEARLRYNNSHPSIVPWRIFRVMVTAFWKSYVSDSGWKAGTVGIIESLFQAFSIFVTYSKLWELQNKNRLRGRP